MMHIIEQCGEYKKMITADDIIQHLLVQLESYKGCYNTDDMLAHIDHMVKKYLSMFQNKLDDYVCICDPINNYISGQRIQIDIGLCIDKKFYGRSIVITSDDISAETVSYSKWTSHNSKIDYSKNYERAMKGI